MSFAAFFDTNVLYGAYLTDFILRLAERGAFRPLWSEGVLEELQRNLIVHHDESAINYRIQTMRDHFPDAMVRGYEPLISGMTNDKKDRHVLAAAVRANAEVLVTFNTKDFPDSSVVLYEIEIVEPDGFLLDQLDLFPGLIMGTLRDWAEDCTSPALSETDLLQALAKSGTPKFAIEVLQRHIER